MISWLRWKALMIQGPIHFRTSNSLPVSRSYFLWSATSCLASMEIESGMPTTSTSFLRTINLIDSHPCIHPLLGKNHPKQHPTDWNHLSDTAGKYLNMRIVVLNSVSWQVVSTCWKNPRASKTRQLIWWRDPIETPQFKRLFLHSFLSCACWSGIKKFKVRCTLFQPSSVM